MAGQSLADGLLDRVPDKIRPAVQELVYSCLRQFGRGDFFLARLLHKPLAEAEIHALLLVAISRLELEPEFAHTVVDQAVTASGVLHNGRFKALTNGVLRAFLRQHPQLQAEAGNDVVATYCHPDWWLIRLRAAFPEAWREVAAAGNQRPPMAVRVNRRRADRDSWLAEFQSIQAGALASGKDGVLLEQALPVGRLPGFVEGLVSVQDPGAQRAVDLLAPASGSRVLDACAAPGGKAAHLLERADIDLLALDLKPARCRMIAENLQRLGLQAEIKVANCVRLDEWWDRRFFDAVLADVPCTASGVVRRHPDSKWLRREADIASFSGQQSAILDALWQVVKPGGKLLYATCSVFPEENHVQMARFVDRTPDAVLEHEEQLLPDREHDAFYYCLLEKKP
ncbi:MAG: Fmu, rRNA SAM-dependent methyltransferase [Proteobacteria bacterium]|nr:Fmu, rRNA SAM-dependent methyltransferase [Pseudomonadota bacterium]